MWVVEKLRDSYIYGKELHLYGKAKYQSEIKRWGPK